MTDETFRGEWQEGRQFRLGEVVVTDDMELVPYPPGRFLRLLRRLLGGPTTRLVRTGTRSAYLVTKAVVSSPPPSDGWELIAEGLPPPDEELVAAVQRKGRELGGFHRISSKTPNEDAGKVCDICGEIIPDDGKCFCW